MKMLDEQQRLMWICIYMNTATAEENMDRKSLKYYIEVTMDTEPSPPLSHMLLLSLP